jgi:tetratricopeptide (TPR) repeat protein
MTMKVKHLLVSLVLLLAAGAAQAGKKDAPPPPPPAPTEKTTVPPPPPTEEEHTAAFADYQAQIASGQKARAADALLYIVTDPTKAPFHAEAWALMGQTLMGLDLPYGALVAYSKSLDLSADAGGASAIINAFELADKVGDPSILEPVFAKNVGGQADKLTRSRMAYLASKENYRQGNLNMALSLLKLVVPESPWYPDAKVLEGVVLNQQDKHETALQSFVTAQATSAKYKKDARFNNALNMNLARSYFAAKNYARAIEYYAKIDRGSDFWLEAQFERAWAHFRLDDMNGALGLLQTIHSPFADPYFFPEAELLRTYALFLLCKFPDATKQVDSFKEEYKPIADNLAMALQKSTTDDWEAAVHYVEKGQTDIPEMFLRQYRLEARFNDSLGAVKHADDELLRLQNISANPFAAQAGQWVQGRRDDIIREEGGRIHARLQKQSNDLGEMLVNADLSKLDMLQMETHFYEAASISGKALSKERTVQRKEKVRKGFLYWPWQGEWWADELGYYRVKAVPECPVGMRPEAESTSPK